MTKKQNSQKKKQRFALQQTILKGLVVVLLLVGGLLAAYPFYARALNNFIDQQKLSYYKRASDKQQQEALEKMEKANKKLQKKEAVLGEDPFTKKREEASSSKFDKEHYIGQVAIDKLNVDIPLYDVTTDRLLSKGATLLKGSSYPTGGEGTHAVILAHRGLPERKLFSDLNKMKKGDIFVLDIMNKKMAYKVDNIAVVKPEDTHLLKIVPGEDLVTLLTCTPYMINSHRLLVRGHRVPYTEKMTSQVKQSNKLRQLEDALILAVTILLVVGALWLLYRLILGYLLSKKQFDITFIRENIHSEPLSGIRYGLFTKSGKNAVKREGLPLQAVSDETGKVVFENIPGGSYSVADASQQHEKKLRIKMKKQNHWQFVLRPRRSEKSRIFKKDNNWVIQKNK